jgi:DNA-binding response OmpR family regulator
LIVDDEADFGAFVRRVAQKLDFEVEVTTTAAGFKESYSRFKPTIVVLDIVMPDVDGIELIRWLAAAHCAARVVIISGFDPYYAMAAEKFGDIGGLTSIQRLTKPVSLADLESALTARGPGKA